MIFDIVVELYQQLMKTPQFPESGLCFNPKIYKKIKILLKFIIQDQFDVDSKKILGIKKMFNTICQMPNA